MQAIELKLFLMFQNQIDNIEQIVKHKLCPVRLSTLQKAAASVCEAEKCVDHIARTERTMTLKSRPALVCLWFISDLNIRA